jgi:hypothetical protein
MDAPPQCEACRLGQAKRYTAEEALKAVVEFNKTHLIGEPCCYFPIAGDPNFLRTITRSLAWVASDQPIVKVNGYAGGVHIDHLAFEEASTK